MNLFLDVFAETGLAHLTVGHPIMWLIGLALVYLAIARKYEPYLLLPIGFGTILVNMPLSGLLDEHGLIRIFYYGIQYEVLPPLIFLGLGAMTDFSPVLANKKTFLLGLGAQVGVFVAFGGAMLLGFTAQEAASIGIIGGADGPTTIYVTNALAPDMIGATAVSAYAYMALVPIIIPPIVRLLTKESERTIRMKQLRPVSKLEKILFPIIATFVICLLIPAATTLMGMFMIGNLFRESGVVKRLAEGAQNELMNIVTILLGLSISMKLTAESFLQWQVVMVFMLGLAAFACSVAGGVLLAKLMNWFLPVDKVINPMIGAAGLSAVPMAARVVQEMGMKECRTNYLLMHAMGPNVAGVIGTVIAAGLFIAFLGG
ncbi:MAG: sodium ion-translocating decarboxylase subunit beta [Candidatus Kerfeldbacteria bacterium]